MLGRSAGLSEAQLTHLDDDPLPPEVFSSAEIAIVRYARQSTLRIVVDDALYGELQAHFSERQCIDLCLIVGLSNLINRFHATFHTDVDESTLEALAAGAEIPLGFPVRPNAAAN